MDLPNPSSWLELGISGALLFILALVLFSMLRNQDTTTAALVSRIDSLITSVADLTNTITDIIVRTNKDQEQVTALLNEIHEDIRTNNMRIKEELSNISSRVVRIDTRLFDNLRKDAE